MNEPSGFDLDRAGADVRSAAASSSPDVPTIESLHGRNRRRQHRRRALAVAVLAVPVLVVSVAVAVALGGGSDRRVVEPAGPAPAGLGASASPEPTTTATLPTTSITVPSTSTSVTTSPTTSRPPSTTTVPPTPHFATPEAAMNYLATAWNDNDLTSLNHVTNPAARAELNGMHDVAVNLRLNHCDGNPAGDYTCYFDHDYPATDSGPEMPGGHAVFLVGPADTPGWYMTVFESCS